MTTTLIVALAIYLVIAVGFYAYMVRSAQPIK